MAMDKSPRLSEIPYKLITEAEMLEREHKYFQRLQDIRACCALVRAAKEQYDELEAERATNERWNYYIMCDGLPKVSNPPELRRFIDKIRHVQHFNKTNSIDWTLSVNERSILTQDIFAEDYTKKMLRKILRPDLGATFNRDVNNCLEVLNRIEYMLDHEEKQLRELDFIQQLEIVEMRSAIEDEINVILDHLTYEALRMDRVYMESIDDKVAEYSYKGENFALHLWGLRNVSIRFNRMEYPCLMAELKTVGVNVQLPLSVLFDCLTLRCIHLNFDTVSQNAKSFECLITENTENISAGIVDLEECLINEWHTQLDLQDEIFQQLENKRMQYEESRRELEELLAQISKDKESKSPAIPKLPKEPQEIPDQMHPDTYHAFLDHEQKQYERFLENFFHPKRLNLSSDQINLRKYIILGGIYSIQFVRRPPHTHFEKFNIVLHENEQYLYTMTDIVAKLFDTDEEQEDGEEETRLTQGLMASVSRIAVQPKLSGSRTRLGFQQRASARTRTASNIKLRMTVDQPLNIVTSEEDMEYFFVTIKLPPHLCLWGEPEVAHFVKDELVPKVQVKAEVDSVVQSTKHKKRKKKDKLRKSNSRENTAAKGKELKVEQLKEKGKRKSSVDENRPRESNKVRFAKVEALNTLSSNVFNSTLLSILRHSKLSIGAPAAELIRNFCLYKQLTKPEIRHLERYCLPRLISSMTFPLELKEAALTMSEMNQMEKPINVFRRTAQPDEPVEEKVPDFYFDFAEQHNPERLFPIFKHTDPIYIMPEPNIVMPNDKEETLYGLLKTLDDIKLNFVSNYKKVLNQPYITPKVPKSITMAPTAPIPSIPQPKVSLSRKSKQTKMKSKASSSSIKLDVHEASEATLNDPIARGLNSLNITTMDVPEGDALSVVTKLSVMSSEVFEEKETLEYCTHWTKKHIFESRFDRDSHTMTIKTDRLGILGFAYKRYQHFPFRYWSLLPNDQNSNEVILTVETYYVRIILYISNKGIRGYVTDITKEYVAKPVRYLDITEPISDFRDLRKRFLEKNINIFAEHDACYYIENGYFTPKHKACEHHCYDVMAMHCKTMKFSHSGWNRLATRRNIVISMKIAKDLTDVNEVLVRITPENTTFVDIVELCSDDLNIFNLEYKLTWRNVSNYSDLHQAIISMNSYANDERNKDIMLMFQIKRILSELSVLSFS